jgi:hypothetical protein
MRQFPACEGLMPVGPTMRGFARQLHKISMAVWIRIACNSLQLKLMLLRSWREGGMARLLASLGYTPLGFGLPFAGSWLFEESLWMVWLSRSSSDCCDTIAVTVKLPSLSCRSWTGSGCSRATPVCSLSSKEPIMIHSRREGERIGLFAHRFAFEEMLLCDLSQGRS